MVYLKDQVSYDFLEVGHYVQLFFDESDDSYPLQVTAKKINIIQ